MENMPPLGAECLARMGFTSREDVRRLENDAWGSLVAGISLVIYKFPRRSSHTKLQSQWFLTFHKLNWLDDLTTISL
jgi:hypothetical protein